MFIDSEIRINEARPLIKEITNSLRIFSRDMSVIVSLGRVPSAQYKMLFPRFDKCIDVRSSDKPAVLMTAIRLDVLGSRISYLRPTFVPAVVFIR